MERRRGFQSLTSVDDALRVFLETSRIKKPKTEAVPLGLSLGRVSAEQVAAREDLPRFDRSAVDGYAVKAEDTLGASQFSPKVVSITKGNEIHKKQAKQVWTGTPIPRGADSVIMIESVKRTGEKAEVWTQLTPQENVSKKGEDLKKGEVGIDSGIRLKPHHLGLLASLGAFEVKVFEKPKIAVLATGDELVRLGEKPKGGRVFDSNSHIVSALCQELGACTIDLGLAGDNLVDIAGKLRKGLECDAIITTGGTSVGEADVVPKAISSLGKPGVVVHGIAMRPAMPTALAVVDNEPVLILSGNPVAAIMGFEVFGRPILCRMLGLRREEHRPTLKAKMKRKIATSLGKTCYVRVNVFEKNDEYVAMPVSSRGSGLISTMTRANGYVIVPSNKEGLNEGENVTVHLFDQVEGAGCSV